MKCRACGTDIADKALICFRCGAATTEPRVRPPAARPRRSPLVAAVAVAMLVLVALFAGQAATGEAPRIVAWTLAALGVVLLLLLWMRRT